METQKLTKILASIAIIIVIFAILIGYVLWSMISKDPQVEVVEQYKLAVELYKVLITGFVVALFGTILPLVIKWSREQFEHSKEARQAYSEAKTGVDYLNLRLATLSLEQAAQCLSNVHVKKHLAETYPELKNYIYSKNVKDWGTKMWKQLDKVRTVLEENCNEWDLLQYSERLKLLSGKDTSDTP